MSNRSHLDAVPLPGPASRGVRVVPEKGVEPSFSARNTYSAIVPVRLPVSDSRSRHEPVYDLSFSQFFPAEILRWPQRRTPH